MIFKLLVALLSIVVDCAEQFALKASGFWIHCIQSGVVVVVEDLT